MCLLVVAWRVVPGLPLLIGANRDEYVDRPATAMTVLQPEGPRLLGGRDEEAGGTWLAVNEHGVFAGLTNQPLKEGKDASRRSRGELPLALAAHTGAEHAAKEFVAAFEPSDYNGSWLLVGDRESLYYIDFTGSVEVEARPLPPGVHVLENRPLGTPSPKSDRVVETLGALTGDGASALEGVLRDHHVSGTVETPKGPRPISNCVHLDGYGTRSSCVLRYGPDRATPPQVLVAEGPPCSTPFVDVSSLWRRAK